MFITFSRTDLRVVGNHSEIEHYQKVNRIHRIRTKHPYRPMSQQDL